MNKNILILSSGRRVELIKLFNIEAQKYRNIKILTADANPNYSPACLLNNKLIKLPLCNSKSFIGELKKKSLQLNVKVIVPTIDSELEVLSKNKEDFHKLGITILISEYSFISKTTNKIETAKIFKKININYPKIYNRNNLRYPSILKPIRGSSSKGIIILKSSDDLSKNMIKNKKNFFQKLIKSHKEYTIDLYYNIDCELIYMIARERIDVRNGEVIKSISDFQVTNKLKILFKNLKGAIGPITIQVFYDKVKKSLYGIEINPRLGGGCTLSYKCGLNFPKYIIEEHIKNKKIKSVIKKFKKNKLLLRYDAEFIKS